MLGKVCIQAKWPIRPVSLSWSNWEYFYSPWMGCKCIAGLPPAVNSPTPIQLVGERHCQSKVSSPRTQQMSPARARTRTTRYGDERTNQEATAPPTVIKCQVYNKNDCKTKGWKCFPNGKLYWNQGLGYMKYWMSYYISGAQWNTVDARI